MLLVLAFFPFSNTLTTICTFLPDKVSSLSCLSVAISLSTANQILQFLVDIHCRKLATGGCIVSPHNTVYIILDHDFTHVSVLLFHNSKYEKSCTLDPSLLRSDIKQIAAIVEVLSVVINDLLLCNTAITNCSKPMLHHLGSIICCHNNNLPTTRAYPSLKNM